MLKFISIVCLAVLIVSCCACTPKKVKKYRYNEMVEFCKQNPEDPDCKRV